MGTEEPSGAFELDCAAPATRFESGKALLFELPADVVLIAAAAPEVVSPPVAAADLEVPVVAPTLCTLPIAALAPTVAARLSTMAG